MNSNAKDDRFGERVVDLIAEMQLYDDELTPAQREMIDLAPVTLSTRDVLIICQTRQDGLEAIEKYLEENYPGWALELARRQPKRRRIK